MVTIPFLEMQLGPVRFVVDPNSQAARRPFDYRLILRETAFRLDGARANLGIQYSGRLHRLHPNKTKVRIFDYVDREVPVLMRMFEKRLRIYRAIGYARGEAPPGSRSRLRSRSSSTTRRRFVTSTILPEEVHAENA